MFFWEVAKKVGKIQIFPSTLLEVKAKFMHYWVSVENKHKYWLAQI
jgi:hypothetical protein